MEHSNFPDELVKVQLACHAMATRFEFVLCGKNKAQLRAAGEEAIREIKRIENKLSFYRPNSIISQINKRASQEPVKVDLETFSFLENVSFLSKETEGAFDPTVAPLMKTWGFINNSGTIPDENLVRRALSITGINHVHLNREKNTVRFDKPGVQFDPGGVGKGYALDQAANFLKETGIKNALIHGGTSTVIAWGESPEKKNWNIAVKHPNKLKKHADDIIEIFTLNNQALSVSAVWGKAFEANDKILGHVIDPRSGYPVDGALLAVCIASNATSADAYSTALLVSSSNNPSFESLTNEISSYFILLNDGRTISSFT